MSDCHHTLEIVQHAEAGDAVAAIADLFLMGLSGSFLHCIGMCGPIASAFMNLRLLHINSKQMQERYKIQAAAALPYYLGKALSYALITIVVGLLVQEIAFIPYIRYIGAILLILVALSYTASGFSELAVWWPVLDRLNIKGVPLQTCISIFLSKVRITNPFGIRGFLLGMILGFIPCGLLYSAIVTAITIAQNPVYAALAMFAFGMGTIPGLFLISYLGQSIMQSGKNAFRLLYLSIIAVNIVFLLSYALRLMGDI